ncbi:MAG: hypothetical protein SOU50_04910 [Oscillospiraceae bacterium]|nr:hypothetical protein [Oscillospiraceae bacterium]
MHQELIQPYKGSEPYLNGLNWGMSIDEVKQLHPGVLEDITDDDELSLKMIQYTGLTYNDISCDVGLMINELGLCAYVYSFSDDSFSYEALHDELTEQFGRPLREGYNYTDKIVVWNTDDFSKIILMENGGICFSSPYYDVLTAYEMVITDSPRRDLYSSIYKLTWGMTYEEVIEADSVFNYSLDEQWTNDESKYTYYSYKNVAFSDYSATLRLDFNENYGLDGYGFIIYDDVFDKLYKEAEQLYGAPDDEKSDSSFHSVQWYDADANFQLYISDSTSGDGKKYVYYGYWAPDSFYDTASQTASDNPMRNLRWGMTIDEVKQSETASLVDEKVTESGNTELSYSGVTFRELPAELVLSISDTKGLEGVNYRMKGDMFRTYYDELCSLYGAPDTESIDDSSYIFAWWYSTENNCQIYISYSVNDDKTHYGIWAEQE